MQWSGVLQPARHSDPLPRRDIAPAFVLVTVDAFPVALADSMVEAIEIDSMTSVDVTFISCPFLSSRDICTQVRSRDSRLDQQSLGF